MIESKILKLGLIPFLEYVSLNNKCAEKDGIYQNWSLCKTKNKIIEEFHDHIELLTYSEIQILMKYCIRQRLIMIFKSQPRTKSKYFILTQDGAKLLQDNKDQDIIKWLGNITRDITGISLIKDEKE